MFHVEIRKFPHLTRSFNLTREQLDERILTPWAAGKAFELGDRSWSPETARLQIYEGPELDLQEIGLGRGWGNATRAGEDVTAAMLAEGERPPATLEQLKEHIVERTTAGRVPLRLAAELAASLQPGARLSECLAVAEQAVWELLHARAVRLTRQAGEVAPDEWRPALLSWDSWAGSPAEQIFVEAGVSPQPAGGTNRPGRPQGAGPTAD